MMSPEEKLRKIGMREVRAPAPRANITLAAWLRKKLPPRDYLLGEMLSTTSRWILYGETGVGKTLIAMDIGGSVSSGSSLLNWRGSGKARVVMYLDGELPSETFKERMEMVAKRYGEDLAFYGYCRDDLGDDAMPPLNTEDGEKWLWKEIDAVKPDIIIFDSIMCLLAGSMSEEESWAPVKGLMRRITARRIAQIWLHHTGHDTSKGFGTKTREWEVDTVVSLTRAEKDPASENVLLEFKKARLRKPETRAQFEPRVISYEEGGWVVTGEGKAGKGAAEKDVVKREIVSAYEHLADAVKPSPGHTKAPVRKVQVKDVRELVKSRGYLDSDDNGHVTSTGRSHFMRAKTDLLKEKSFAEENGNMWRIRP